MNPFRRVLRNPVRPAPPVQGGILPPPILRSSFFGTPGMTQAFFFHHSPTLLLAAALVALVIFLVHDSSSAQAQQTSNPVRNLTLTQTGLSSLTVAWDSPASGDALHYEVRLTDNDTGGSVHRTIVYSGRSAEIGNLNHGVIYTASVGVWFRNSAGFGDETSATITLSDGGVENLTATAISQDTISVGWERPAFPRRIRWYVVRLLDKSAGVIVTDKDKTVLPGELGTEISGLTSETSYEVRVHIVEYGGGLAFYPTKTVEVTTLPASAGVTVTAANPLSVNEGATATYTVVLDTRPTADVTITPSSDDTDSATVSPASHTFTTSNWNTPATFTVSGVADADSNDESVAISHSVTSDDGKYGSVIVSTVRVSVSDTTQAGQQEQETENPYADLIAEIYESRNNSRWSSYKSHTDRWDRVLLAFGETVADASLTPMTADEAQKWADEGWDLWIRTTAALREIEAAPQQQQQTTNREPTVSSAIADATIVNESGTKQVSLSGVFSDADSDTLTVTASSSDTAKATASVSSDYSTLTVTAKARGTATITVTANDRNGGTVSDAFTVTVKAAPTVVSTISDVSALEAGSTRDVSLSGVFSDADSDSLTISAASSDDGKATVSVASDYSKLTLTGVAAGTETITVTAQDSDGNMVSDSFDVTVPAAQQQQTTNRTPTVASAIADATIANESGTKQVSLSGVFSDADSDSLTVTAASSDTAKATVSVASDYSTLTVNAEARGTATITVTANDGNRGTVSDAFTVTVKAAPVVSSALADVTGLETGATQDVFLSGVFSDADGDALTITAASDDEAIATVSVAADRSRLTLAGVSAGTATITVTARDGDGNQVSDSFSVTVAAPPAGEEEEQESTLTGVAARYDANGDGKIDRSEYEQARQDYEDRKITALELWQVRRAYEDSLD